MKRGKLITRKAIAAGWRFDDTRRNTKRRDETHGILLCPCGEHTALSAEHLGEGDPNVFHIWARQIRRCPATAQFRV